MSTPDGNGPAMRSLSPRVRKVRFGAFELDLRDRELRKGGLTLRLQQKPFQVLEMLVQNPGALVTRAELARHLWPNTHVSFDRSLNTVVNSLRQVLGDSSRISRYIETRSGLGYKFVAHVEEIGQPAPSAPPERIAIERQITTQLVKALRLSPNESHARRLKKNYDANLEAHVDYLKGRYFYNRTTEEDLRKSIAHFEAALRQDPGCSLAYAGLADIYSLFAFFGVIPPRDASSRARQLAMRALECDEELAEAHVSLASVKRLFDWDWQGAEAGYLRALDLNPNHADAHRCYASHLSAMARSEESIREIRTAQELDPLSLVINSETAWNLYMARDFKGALEESWKTLILEPKFAAAQHALGLAYEQLGMSDEAITEFQNAHVCSSGHPSTIAALGHAHAIAGNQCDAADSLRELERLSKNRYVSRYWFSLVYTGLGSNDSAIDSLESAYRDRDVWLVWLKVEPRFDPLRSNARFQNLLRELRFDNYA